MNLLLPYHFSTAPHFSKNKNGNWTLFIILQIIILFAVMTRRELNLTESWIFEAWTNKDFRRLMIFFILTNNF